MAVATFSAPIALDTDANVKLWAKGLSDALQAMVNLTKVNDLAALVGSAGSAPMDFTDVTATGVTVTAGLATFSGTFSRPLTQQDVGRQMRLPMGTAGANQTTFILSVTGAGAGTMGSNATVGIAGTGTAIVGVLAMNNGSFGMTAGYEIYRFNDTLQASCPVYMKIIYGGSQAQVGFTLQFGTGTNGYGILTGVQTTAQQFLVSLDAALRTCYVSCAAGRLGVHLFNEAANTNKMTFGMCRSVDAAGVQDDRYVHTLIYWAGTFKVQLLPKTGGIFPTTALTNVLVGIAQGQTSASYGGNLGIFPVHPYRGRADNPCMDFCAYYVNDIPSGNFVTVTQYGVARTYLALGLQNTGALSSAPGGGAGGAALMMRYE